MEDAEDAEDVVKEKKKEKNSFFSLKDATTAGS